MGLGIKSFLRSIIMYTKEEKKVPILQTPISGHEFDGKVVLITGGTGGIGAAMADRLYKSGARIILCGTNSNKMKAIQEKYDSSRFSVLEYNNSSVVEFPEKIANAASKFGYLDILICSAGVHTENIDFWNVTEKEFDRVVDINLKGTYFTCLEFAKYMKNNKRKGHILLISSSRGSEPAWSPYGISKWGLKGITEGFAKMLLEYGINVNAIAPGSTATTLIGFKSGDSIYTSENNAGRMIIPEEVASLASYLVSDAGDMITGETIHISAGRGVIDLR